VAPSEYRSEAGVACEAAPTQQQLPVSTARCLETVSYTVTVSIVYTYIHKASKRLVAGQGPPSKPQTPGKPASLLVGTVSCM
jgi:hypothetical protein